MKELFSFKGRICKIQYKRRVRASIIVGVADLVFMFLFLVIFKVDVPEDPPILIIIAIGIVIIIAALWVYLATIVKRLHDIGESGEKVWLLLIPVLGEIYWIQLKSKLNQVGMIGSNEYGQDPLEDKDPLHISSKPIEPK